MQGKVHSFSSSLIKKYLMAITGLGLAGFVLGHMLGNLQVFPIFGGAETFNAYANRLQTLPYGLLWIGRFALLIAIIVHVWMAVLISLENRRARPVGYQTEGTVVASYASRTMRWSGFILLAFILFHLAHYTVRVVPGMEYGEKLEPAILTSEGHPVIRGEEPVLVFDAHTMVIVGFSNVWVSLFYIFSMGLLCLHLSHGISSMFQTVGLRNRIWWKPLDRLAVAFAWIIFLGFVSVPIAVLAGFLQIAS